MFICLYLQRSIANKKHHGKSGDSKRKERALYIFVPLMTFFPLLNKGFGHFVLHMVAK